MGDDMKFMDWFIPQELRLDAVTYMKARQIVGIGLFLAITVVLNSPRSFSMGDFKTGMIAIVLSLVILGSNLLLEYFRSIPLSANGIAISFFALLLYIIVNQKFDLRVSGRRL